MLSHRISNTMDSQLVMSVLNDALEKYPHPEIFNTDQGSQYTSEIHTKRLKDWVLQYPWMAKAEPQTNFTIEQKLDYAKLMVNENYINKKIMAISGAEPSAVTRWKRQYLAEIIWLGCAKVSIGLFFYSIDCINRYNLMASDTMFHNNSDLFLT